MQSEVGKLELKAILYRAYRICSNITFHDTNEYDLDVPATNRAIWDIEDEIVNQDKKKYTLIFYAFLIKLAEAINW